MPRLVLLFAVVVLPIIVTAPRADEDPEPPRPAPSTVTSGNFTVSSAKGGAIVALDKQGKQVWKFQVGWNDRKTQLAIEGDLVVAYQEGRATALFLRSGRLNWQVTCDIKRATMKVGNGEVVIQAGKSKDVIDIRNGQVLIRHR